MLWLTASSQRTSVNHGIGLLSYDTSPLGCGGGMQCRPQCRIKAGEMMQFCFNSSACSSDELLLITDF